MEYAINEASEAPSMPSTGIRSKSRTIVANKADRGRDGNETRVPAALHVAAHQSLEGERDHGDDRDSKGAGPLDVGGAEEDLQEERCEHRDDQSDGDHHDEGEPDGPLSKAGLPEVEPRDRREQIGGGRACYLRDDFRHPDGDQVDPSGAQVDEQGHQEQIQAKVQHLQDVPDLAAQPQRQGFASEPRIERQSQSAYHPSDDERREDCGDHGRERSASDVPRGCRGSEREQERDYEQGTDPLDRLGRQVSRPAIVAEEQRARKLERHDARRQEACRKTEAGGVVIEGYR